MTTGTSFANCCSTSGCDVPIVPSPGVTVEVLQDANGSDYISVRPDDVTRIAWMAASAEEVLPDDFIPFNRGGTPGDAQSGDYYTARVSEIADALAASGPTALAALKAALDTDTFAALSGPILTMPDGQTYDLTDTDTAATLTGAVITFPDGQTFNLASVDTDTFAAISGTTITFPDGTTFDVASVNTDTDTFATISGTLVTFADGTTFDLASVDTDTAATNAGSVITFADGSTFDVASVDTDTFATRSGTVITFADGSTFDVASVNTDTDTFATINGDIITFADGQTVDLGAIDTAATASGSVITFPDGSTLDVASFDTDTDTFATISGSVVTFADGTTFDTASVDTDTFATISGSVITFADGQTVDLGAIADTFATLSGTVITFPSGDTLDVAATDTKAVITGGVVSFADGQTYDLNTAQETLTRRTTSGETHILDWDDQDGNTEELHEGKINLSAPNAIVRDDGDLLYCPPGLLFHGKLGNAASTSTTTSIPPSTNVQLPIHTAFVDKLGWYDAANSRLLFPNFIATESLFMDIDANWSGSLRPSQLIASSTSDSWSRYNTITLDSSRTNWRLFQTNSIVFGEVNPGDTLEILMRNTTGTTQGVRLGRNFFTGHLTIWNLGGYYEP